MFMVISFAICGSFLLKSTKKLHNGKLNTRSFLLLKFFYVNDDVATDKKSIANTMKTTKA